MFSEALAHFCLLLLKLLVKNFVYIGTFRGLCPPPPLPPSPHDTKTAGYTTAGASCSMMVSNWRFHKSS